MKKLNFVFRYTNMLNVVFHRIGFISPSHRIFELLNMNLLFPNVQVADLKVCYPKLCTDCYADHEPFLVQNDPEQKKIYYRQAHTCVRLAHSSFAKFRKLTALWTLTNSEKIDYLKNYSFNQETLKEFISLDKIQPNSSADDFDKKFLHSNYSLL